MRNPGYILQHQDGRKGIAYIKDQLSVKKWAVVLVDEKFKPTGERSMWPNEKVIVIGRVD